MVFFQEKEVYSDSDDYSEDEEKNEKNEIKKEIQENDNWYNFLDLYHQIQDKYNNFYFLNFVPAHNVYNIKMKEFPGFNKEIHKIGKNDKYWVMCLIDGIGADIEVNESVIYDFYINIENLNKFKEKKKDTFKVWNVYQNFLMK